MWLGGKMLSVVYSQVLVRNCWCWVVWVLRFYGLASHPIPALLSYSGWRVSSWILASATRASCQPGCAFRYLNCFRYSTQQQGKPLRQGPSIWRHKRLIIFQNYWKIDLSQPRRNGQDLMGEWTQCWSRSSNFKLCHKMVKESLQSRGSICLPRNLSTQNNLFWREDRMVTPHKLPKYKILKTAF